MNRIQSIKHSHSLKVFRKRARRVAFPHQFVSFSRAKTLGFIINISLISMDELMFFIQHLEELEKEGKKILVVELNFLRNAEPMFNAAQKSIFLNSNNINWLRFPTVSILKQINAAKIDILYNLDTSEQMTSRFICGLSNAKMRVGVHESEYEEFYELMLQLETGASLQQVLETSDAFTKKLEKKK